jgi:predicted DNA-binding transcriptional regulator YafY
VPVHDFLSELEISLATFKRDLEILRSRFSAPIIYDRFSNGYTFDLKSHVGPKFELPGLWFNPQEATALVTMQQLLSSLDRGGLIGAHIAPMMSKIDSILGNGQTPSKELRKRIKVIGMGSRTSDARCFELLGKALLDRSRLEISYYAKSNNETTTREVSPQRLIYYRDNWYLDAYCHTKKALRSFSADGISKAQILNIPCHEVPEKEMSEEFTQSYGIFSGKATAKAVLKFTPNRARWLSKEIWHPKQQGRYDEAGFYILEFDFHKTEELIMDILKYGPDVEVIEPKDLREKVRDEINNMSKKYYS